MPTMETIEQLLMIKAVWVVSSAAIFLSGAALLYRARKRHDARLESKDKSNGRA